MNRKDTIKKILLVFLLLVLLFTTYYIWNFYNAKDNRLSNKNQNNPPQNQQNINQTQDMVQDNVIANELRQEKAVQYGYVYVHSKLVFAPIVLKDDVTKDDAQKLVSKYASLLKAKYADREVSVQSVDMKGNVIAGATQ